MNRYLGLLRITRVLLAVLLISLSCTGVASGIEEVRVALRDEPSTVNPLIYGTSSKPVFWAVYQGLMGLTNMEKDGRKDLELADSVEILPSKREIKVTLRKGPRFHTDDPVTAHDVKFTYDGITDPENASTIASIMDEIEEIEVIDEHTLIFRFFEPYAAWANVLSAPIASKKYYEKVGKKRFGAHPIGSGPFRFVSWEKGSSITLEGIPDHLDHPVSFNRLTFVFVRDGTTRTAMLESEDLDLITDIAPHQAVQLRKKGHLRIKTTDKVPCLFSLGTKASWFPELKDKRIRLAIHYAINRQEIVDRLYMGAGYPVYIYADKIAFGYDSTLTREYNPEKARQLLKEAGYDHSKPMTLVYTNMIPNGNLLAQIIQRYLQNVGIKIKLHQIEWGTYVTYLRSNNKNAGHMSITAKRWDVDPDVKLKFVWKSDGFACMYTDRPNQAEFDRLILAQSKELDHQKRVDILKKIYRLDFDDPAYVPLFGLQMIYGMNKRIDYTWNDGSDEIAKLYNIRILE